MVICSTFVCVLKPSLSVDFDMNGERMCFSQCYIYSTFHGLWHRNVGKKKNREQRTKDIQSAAEQDLGTQNAVSP